LWKASGIIVSAVIASSAPAPNARSRGGHASLSEPNPTYPAAIAAAAPIAIALQSRKMEVRIGEAGNLAVLKKEEWNVLVDLIQSGQLGRV
jgi:hypothetical protein